MSLFHKIKQEYSPEKLYLLTEISREDFVKYEFNHKYDVLEVDRVLYGPVHYPVVYCDVPRTWNSADGDPLDAVLYTTGNIVPGALVTGRVVGMMSMIDNGEEDHKVICVNDKDSRYDDIDSIDDLSKSTLKDLKTFMETYKYAQTGPGTVEVPGFKGKKSAYELIRKSMDEYNELFGNHNDHEDHNCACGNPECGCHH